MTYYCGGRATHKIGSMPESYGMLAKQAIAEFVATMLFIFISTAAVIGAFIGGEPIIINASLTFGLTIVVLAYSIGHISGAHINPAVTAGLMVTGHKDVVSGFVYIFSQLAGGIVGSALVRAMVTDPDENENPVLWSGITLARNGFSNTSLSVTFPEDVLAEMNLTTPAQIAAAQSGVQRYAVTNANAFVAEFMIAFFLAFVVHATAVEPKSEGNRSMAPLAIGLCVGVCHFATVAITGTSLNPARNLGPNIVTGTEFPDGWAISFFIPFVGCMVGALFYQWVLMTPFTAGESGDKADDVPMDDNNDGNDAADPEVGSSVGGSVSGSNVSSSY